jgi:hypothetical protein
MRSFQWVGRRREKKLLYVMARRPLKYVSSDGAERIGGRDSAAANLARSRAQRGDAHDSPSCGSWTLCPHYHAIAGWLWVGAWGRCAAAPADALMCGAARILAPHAPAHAPHAQHAPHSHSARSAHACNSAQVAAADLTEAQQSGLGSAARRAGEAGTAGSVGEGSAAS